MTSTRRAATLLPLLLLLSQRLDAHTIPSCAGERPLLVVAHADDETLFGLPVLRTAGLCRPHVVLVTAPDAVRLRGLLRASATLNFTHESLGLADGAKHNDFDRNATLLTRLRSILFGGSDDDASTTASAWSAVYTHGPTGEYGHPQHIQCSRVVTALLLASRLPQPVVGRLFYFAPRVGDPSEAVSDAHAAVAALYPEEALAWSATWHARVVPWHAYDLAAARAACVHPSGYPLYRRNCGLVGSPAVLARRPRRRRTIGVVHYRDGSTPMASFEVGFRHALGLLEKIHGYDVLMLNMHDLQGLLPGSEPYRRAMRRYAVPDVLFVKSNWAWIPDRFVRESTHLRHILVPKVLLISGVAPVPTEPPEAQAFYDALVYETEWYARWQRLRERHPNVHQAFGIDTRIMSARKATAEEHEEDWDWDLLFVGWMAPWKRLDRFAARYRGMCDEAAQRGARMPTALAVGKLDATDASPGLVAMLRASGVVVRGEVPYTQLAALLHRTREVYIPSTLQGGGERAVLEARACGVKVTVEDDNPKLRELATAPGPVPGNMAYADGLHRVLQSLLAPRPRLADDIVGTGE